MSFYIHAGFTSLAMAVSGSLMQSMAGLNDLNSHAQKFNNDNCAQKMCWRCHSSIPDRSITSFPVLDKPSSREVHIKQLCDERWFIERWFLDSVFFNEFPKLHWKFISYIIHHSYCAYIKCAKSCRTRNLVWPVKSGIRTATINENNFY